MNSLYSSISEGVKENKERSLADWFKEEKGSLGDYDEFYEKADNPTAIWNPISWD